jgi:hypothetical protein
MRRSHIFIPDWIPQFRDGDLEKVRYFKQYESKLFLLVVISNVS